MLGEGKGKEHRYVDWGHAEHNCNGKDGGVKEGTCTGQSCKGRTFRASKIEKVDVEASKVTLESGDEFSFPASNALSKVGGTVTMEDGTTFKNPNAFREAADLGPSALLM